MSYETWVNYGFGICVDEIKEESVKRLRDLLALAPELNSEISKWLETEKIESPSWEDYMSFDTDYYLGLATILRRAINEAEGIEMVACNDSDDKGYLLYAPQYPWNAKEKEQDFTEEYIKQIFGKYVGILTDDPVEVDYQEAENGG